VDGLALEYGAEGGREAPEEGRDHQCAIVPPEPLLDAEEADVQAADAAFDRANDEAVQDLDGVDVLEEEGQPVRMVLRHPEQVSAGAILDAEEVGYADDGEGKLCTGQSVCAEKWGVKQAMGAYPSENDQIVVPPEVLAAFAAGIEAQSDTNGSQDEEDDGAGYDACGLGLFQVQAWGHLHGHYSDKVAANAWVGDEALEDYS